LKLDLNKKQINMKIALYISLLFCFCLARIQAQDAGPQNTAPKDNVMQPLQNKNLSAQNLATYQLLAVSKMKDILDYIGIIGNKDYHRSMRETALNTVLKNFDKDAKITCDWLGIKGSGKNKRDCSPQAILSQLLESKKNAFVIDYTNIHITESLKKQPNGNYKGVLQFEQSNSNKKQTLSMAFVLTRIQKTFGNQKEEIWEIRLLGN
jgi:hypothetical protein